MMYHWGQGFLEELRNSAAGYSAVNGCTNAIGVRPFQGGSLGGYLRSTLELGISSVRAAWTSVWSGAKYLLGRDPTVPESLVMLGFLGYGAWAVNGPRTRKVASWVVEKLIPGWQRVKVILGARPRETLASPSTDAVLLESPVAGSIESAMLPPKQQGLVSVWDGTQYTNFGCAFRLNNWIIMPQHVYDGAATMGDDPVVVRKVGAVTHMVLTGKEPTYLDTDIIAFKCSDAECSKSGLPISSVAHEPATNTTYVQIAGMAGKGTTGNVRFDPEVFGKLLYAATTTTGYSGALYMRASKVVGIHTSGGCVNAGYSAGYLLTLLNREDRIRPEGSEEWLQDIFRNRNEIFVHGGDMDEISVRYRGKFAMVERTKFERTFGKEWRSKVGSDFKFGYENNYDLESGEQQESESFPGVSKSSNPSGEKQPSFNQVLMGKLNKLSTKKKKELSKNLDSIMYGPEPQQAQN